MSKALVLECQLILSKKAMIQKFNQNSSSENRLATKIKNKLNDDVHNKRLRKKASSSYTALQEFSHTWTLNIGCEWYF